MGLRQWVRQHLGDEAPGTSAAPPGALGEFTAATYPQELTDLLQRRQRVAEEVLGIDVTDAQARMAAIPRLRELLRTYPHPLVYELLVHAYVDAGRYDEAKGIAFAARERRAECERSPYPEIRSETEHLHPWTADEIEAMRRERQG